MSLSKLKIFLVYIIKQPFIYIWDLLLAIFSVKTIVALKFFDLAFLLYSIKIKSEILTYIAIFFFLLVFAIEEYQKGDFIGEYRQKYKKVNNNQEKIK